MDIAGILLLLTGAVLLYWQRKRKYDRSNDYGVERLPSYFGLFRARLADSILILIGSGSLVMGVVLLAFQHMELWGWLVLFPVAIWMAVFLS